MPKFFPGIRESRVKIDRLAPGDNSKKLNTSLKRHGLAPKLSGDATEFLNGEGEYTTPTGVFPAPHASTHENGGSDEINVAGLSGVLADPQTAIAHAILGPIHSDAATDTVSRGSLIVGNATPSWDELTIGSAGQVLTSDGTDAAWAAPAGGGTVFADNVFRIEDNGDPTKELAFEVSPISSGQTRTVTVQNSSGTMMLLEANQTFTGAINFPPGSVADPPTFHCDDSQGGFPDNNFATIRDNASGLDFFLMLVGDVSAGIQTLFLPAAGGDVVTTDAAQTLSVKVMDADTVLRSFTAASGTSFSDITTATKRLRVILSGAVGNNSIVISSTAARQYTFPNATGNVPIVGNDPPAVAAGALGIVDTTALAAAVGATNLTNGAVVGVYVIHYEMTCTTGDATAGTITFDITCTGDQGAQTISSAALPLTTATASATNPVRGTLVRYLASGELSYAVAVTGAFNNARAAVRARIVFMG